MSNFNTSIKQRDAQSATFVLLSLKVGVDIILMWQILQLYIYNYSLEMEEQIIIAAFIVLV